MLSEMLMLMGTMLFLMLTGALLRKKKIVTDSGKKSITDIVLYVILPCNIVKAFCVETGKDFWSGFSLMLMVAVCVQLVSMMTARFAYFYMKDREKQVYQYGTVCSNAGFMGNPLSQSVFGDTGLLYASIFLIPLRIVMWTAGVSYFSDKADKKQLLKKVLLHPCMIAVYIGMFLLLTQWELPAVVMKTVTYFSNCCTAMTMMYVGTILADVDFRTLFTRHQIYFAVIRLIVLPGIVYAFCQLFRIEQLIMGVAVFLTAMPAGSTTSLLAAKYGADEEAAAKSVVFTTALSVVTLSLWYMILK